MITTNTTEICSDQCSAGLVAANPEPPLPPPPLSLSTVNDGDDKETKTSNKMVYLVLALVLISVILLLATIAFFIATYLPRPTGEEEKREKGGDLEKGILSCKFVDGEKNVVKKYSWDEIKRLTMDFTAPVIGRGGYSIVYLGKLPDSTLVAVKVHQESERLHQAFKQELEVLIRVRHDHIVRLIGFCHEKEEGALVFEYIPNGTLHEKLHGIDDEIDATTTSILTWSERMIIAYTLASSLEYLHGQCDPQIIHGDVKPSNILLSNSLHTKICDFGSAKIGFSSSISPVTTTNSRRFRNAVIGSPGYSDPHYLRTGMTSKKSDVYSFGVVVMELVTGLEAFNEEKGKVLSAAMAGMVDERLGSEFDAAERDIVAAVVRRCVGAQPSLRPSMAEIVGIFQEKVQNSILVVDRKRLL